MERVLANTLAADRGQRFLQHGFLEEIPFSLIGSPRFHETVDSPVERCQDGRRNG